MLLSEANERGNLLKPILVSQTLLETQIFVCLKQRTGKSTLKQARCGSSGPGAGLTQSGEGTQRNTVDRFDEQRLRTVKQSELS